MITCTLISPQSVLDWHEICFQMMHLLFSDSSLAQRMLVLKSKSLSIQLFLPGKKKYFLCAYNKARIISKALFACLICRLHA